MTSSMQHSTGPTVSMQLSMSSSSLLIMRSAVLKCVLDIDLVNARTVP